MLGLPSATEKRLQIPKARIYRDKDIRAAARRLFDEDVSRIDIVNEVSVATTAISEGKTDKGFYVWLVTLKRGDIDKKNIELLVECFPQNIVLVLSDGSSGRLAVHRGGIHIGSESPLSELDLKLEGLDFDEVWRNIVIQIGDIHVTKGNDLDSQIAIDRQVADLDKKIASLDKKARSQVMSRIKNAMIDELKELRRMRNALVNGGNQDA